MARISNPDIIRLAGLTREPAAMSGDGGVFSETGLDIGGLGLDIGGLGATTDAEPEVGGTTRWFGEHAPLVVGGVVGIVALIWFLGRK